MDTRLGDGRQVFGAKNGTVELALDFEEGAEGRDEGGDGRREGAVEWSVPEEEKCEITGEVKVERECGMSIDGKSCSSWWSQEGKGICQK